MRRHYVKPKSRSSWWTTNRNPQSVLVVAKGTCANKARELPAAIAAAGISSVVTIVRDAHEVVVKIHGDDRRKALALVASLLG